MQHETLFVLCDDQEVDDGAYRPDQDEKRCHRRPDMPALSHRKAPHMAT